MNPVLTGVNEGKYLNESNHQKPSDSAKKENPYVLSGDAFPPTIPNEPKYLSLKLLSSKIDLAIDELANKITDIYANYLTEKYGIVQGREYPSSVAVDFFRSTLKGMLGISLSGLHYSSKLCTGPLVLNASRVSRIANDFFPTISDICIRKNRPFEGYHHIGEQHYDWLPYEIWMLPDKTCDPWDKPIFHDDCKLS
jgi:hypothetical protein